MALTKCGKCLLNINNVCMKMSGNIKEFNHIKQKLTTDIKLVSIKQAYQLCKGKYIIINKK